MVTDSASPTKRRRSKWLVRGALVVLLGAALVWAVVTAGRSDTVAAGVEEQSPDTSVVSSAEPSESVGSSDPGGVSGDGGALDSGAEPSPDFTPAGLSTGPVLEWRAVDPIFPDFTATEQVHRDLQPVGDGRIVALYRWWPGQDDQESPQPSGIVKVTTDGLTWQTLPIPEGITPDVVDISTDRWLVMGSDGDAWRGDPSRIFTSVDSGRTWTESRFEPDDTSSLPSWLARSFGWSEVMVSRHGVVVAQSEHLVFDSEGLLAERGLLPAGTYVVGERVSFDTPDSGSIDFYLQSDRGSDDPLPDPWNYEGVTLGFDQAPCEAADDSHGYSMSSTGYGLPESSEAANVEVLTATFAELGLGERELAAIYRAASYQSEQVSVFWADGSTSELTRVAEYENTRLSGRYREGEGVLRDGFVVAISTDLCPGRAITSHYRHRWIVSSDGESWRDLTEDDVDFERRGDARWWEWGGGPANWQHRPESLRKPLNDLNVPTPGRDGSSPCCPDIGPAGLVMVMDAPSPPTAAELEMEAALKAMEIQLTKDVYQLTVPAVGNGLTLVELETGAVIYHFDEIDPGSDPPPGIRTVEPDESMLADPSDPADFEAALDLGMIVFEDPDTGDDLVSFTMGELYRAMMEAHVDAGLGDPFEPVTSDTDEGGSEGPEVVVVTSIVTEFSGGPDDIFYDDYPDQWLGWSADGVSWGWQDTIQAFGDSAREVHWIQVAVGGDFVIALVGDRVFVADVP